jgi:hypothetical protein
LQREPVGDREGHTLPYVNVECTIRLWEGATLAVAHWFPQ